MKIRTLILTTVISASILSSQAQASGFGDIIGGVGTTISGTVRGVGSIALGGFKLPFDMVKFAYNNPKTTTAVISATLAVAYACHRDPNLYTSVQTNVTSYLKPAGEAISGIAADASKLAQPYLESAQSYAGTAWTTASTFVQNIPTKVDEGFSSFDSIMTTMKDKAAESFTAEQDSINDWYTAADSAVRTGAKSTLSVVETIASDTNAQAAASGFLGATVAHMVTRLAFWRK